jgi:hypothetical protein
MIYYVGSEVLITIVMNSAISWDINRRFGGTFRLQLQGRRISQARNQKEEGSKMRFEAVALSILNRRRKIIK